jgi:hypothetical protein
LWWDGLLSDWLCWIRDPLERENELRYTIDPLGGGSNGGINRRTSMSVTDMSNLAAINNQQQRLCSVCCRRDVSCPFSSAVNPSATHTQKQLVSIQERSLNKKTFFGGFI